MLTVRRKCALKAREKRTTKPEPEEPPKGLQLKDRDTKRDNRAIVTRHRQRIGQGGGKPTAGGVSTRRIR